TGLLDEIRVSSSAHTSQRIGQDFNGDSPLSVTSYGPREVARAKASQTRPVTQVTINGYNLDGLTARVTRNGQPIDVAVGVDTTSYRQARFSLAPAPSIPLGSAQLVVSKQGQQDVALNIQITEQSEFAAESDAVVLWHLDEAGNGAARILDSALLSIDGTASASSLAQTGRFGGARSSASIVADDDFLSLGFGSSSFTVECWFKTDPVGVNANLVAKINSNGVSNPDFALKLLPSGALRAQLFNGPGVEWRLDVLHTTYVADDNQWHLVAMVVDRTTDQL